MSMTEKDKKKINITLNETQTWPVERINTLQAHVKATCQCNTIVQGE